VLVLLPVVWGAAVIADSAQFSAAVTELGEPQNTVGPRAFKISDTTYGISDIVEPAPRFRSALHPRRPGDRPAPRREHAEAFLGR
jgi:hypothetical protein